MQKDYVFWALFALVLAGIAGTLIRDSRRRKKREAEEARLRAQAPAPARAAVPPPAASPGAHASAETFDPAATRVHVRTAPIGAPALMPNHHGVTLPREAAPRLVCVSGSQKDNSFPITETGITAGRKAGNDIVITDARASNHHAWIGIVGRKVILRDLGSTNGTFLNARIDVPISEVELSPGDTIFFGGHGRDQFRFVVD